MLSPRQLCFYFFKSAAIAANCPSAASKSAAIGKPGRCGASVTAKPASPFRLRYGCRDDVGEIRAVFEAWKARPLLRSRYGGELGEDGMAARAIEH
jgi:hypothetical protein